jgi:glycosyltransferase involved in cell wall biosynthesis
MKIAFAIPTYNRLQKLKVLVNSILFQEIPLQDVEIYCVISNSCSTDGTSEYLDSLQDENIKFIVRNQVDYENGEVVYVDTRENVLRLIKAIPDDIDWVWFMGDDDFLVGEEVILGLVDLLIADPDPNLTIIHACQARRSTNTGEVFKAPLFDLCNTMGFHEMLGWMSSLIVRKDRFIEALQSDLLYISQSAYTHSAIFLESCCNDMAIFIDTEWVEPQDEAQTEESKQRWIHDNMIERYFYVVDDLIALYEKGVLKRKCTPVFFRYLTYSFWDRYLGYLIAEALNTHQISDKAEDHWNRVLKIADMLEEPAQQKIHRDWVKAKFRDVENFVMAQNQAELLKSALLESFEAQSSDVYPFTNL